MKRVLRWKHLAPLSGNVLVDAATARRAGRGAFYAALSREAPAVLEDLAQSCLATVPSSHHIAFIPPEKWPDAEPIGPCVTAWAQRHKLHWHWLIEDTIYSLVRVKATTVSPSSGIALRPRTTSGEDPGRPSPRPSAGLVELEVAYGWLYSSQPRDLIKAAIMELVENRVDDELNRIEAEATAAGMIAVERRELDRHMDWLVCYVVFGDSRKTIAKREGVGSTAVSRALDDKANLIGLLPLPERKGGRPRAR